MKKPARKLYKLSTSLLVLGLLILATNVRATVYYWDPEGTSTATTNNLTGTWATTGNQWGSTSSQTASPTTWPQSAAACFCAGSTTVAGQFAVSVNSSNIIIGGIYNGPLNPPGYNVVINGTGALILSNTVCAFDTGGSDGDPTIINCILAGTGPLQSQGSGGLYLYGANTFTGGFDIDGGGGVSFGNNSAFGTGTITWQTFGFIQPATTSAYNIPNAMTHIAGGIETFSGNTAGVTFSGPWSIGSSGYVELENIAGAITVSGPISGSANLTFTNKTGTTATWTLTGPNIFTGALTNGLGNLTIGGAGVLGGGTYAGNIMNRGNLIYNSSANQTLSGVISGAGVLTEAGSGILVLSGADTYSGGTLISGGTLMVAGAGTLPASGKITNNASLAYSSSATETLSGIISGTGSLTESAGALTLSGGNTYAGQTVISGGLLTINSDGNLGTAPGSFNTSSIQISSGTNGNLGLRINASMTLNANRGILLGSGGGQIQVAGNDTLTYNGVISGSGGFECGTGTTVGEGTVALGGSNTYSGPTIIACGILKLGTNGALPSGTPLTIASAAAGGTLNMNGFSQTIGPLASSAGIGGTGTVTPTINLSGALTIEETNSTIFAGGITGSGGSLTLDGGNTLTLTGSNSYSGPTILTYGILALGANGSISNTASISIAPGQTLDVSAISAFDLSSATALIATGTLAPAVINGASGGTVDLGSQPITLNFDGTHPVLSIAQGTLVLNANPFTINASPLAAGTYTLVQQASGTVSATGTSAVTGTAIAAGTTGSISVSGGNVNLIIVPNPSFSGLITPSSIIYGASPVSLSGTLSAPGPIYPAMGETVTVTINGNAQNATINDSTGDFSFNYNSAILPVSGSPFTITYSYAGDSSLGVASDNSTSLTVTPAPLTVTAGSQAKTYGQAVTFGSGSANFTSSGLQNGETIGSVTLAVSANGGAPNAPVSGSPYTITASAATGGTFNPANYSISYNSGLLTVGPASLTVAADSVSRPYGATNPVFTVSYTNFVNGETLGTSDVTGSPVLATAADTNSDVGAYVVTNTIGTLASTDYTFSLVNGMLAVTNAVSTNVVAASANPALPGTAIVFSATLSTIAPSTAVPTNLVQFVIDGTNFGSAIYPSNGVVSITNASLSHGYHIIEADYDGDTNTLGATNIVGSTNTLSELINTPPVAGPATYSRVAGMPLNLPIDNLLTNATDADGDALTLVSVSPLSTNGATVVTNSGVITYTPPATNGNVTDVFSYAVEDTYGATNTGYVTVTVLSEASGPPVNITKVTTFANGSAQISFTGGPNYYYLIEATANLSSPITWTILSTNQADTNGMVTFTDTTATNYPVRYYRTAIPPGD